MRDAALLELTAYAGLLPFCAALLGVALLPGYAERELAQRAALGWGAVILAFLGAVHWGLGLAGRMRLTPRRVAGAVLPALLGAAAVMLEGQRGFALLVVGFGIFWMYERGEVAPDLPPAYLALRRNLTLAVCLLLAVTMILSDSRGLR